MDKAEFYDRDRVGVLPTAFCFPGYNAAGSDLPPPPVCWKTWHARVLEEIGPVPLRVIVGGYAIKKHLGDSRPVTEAVADWNARPNGTFVLPHPSWRNTGWLKRNPWFGDEILPALREAVRQVLAD